MRRLARTTLLAAALALAAASSAAPAGAATYAPIASNTTDDITAVEYQSADRFWFATGSGKIFRRVGGAFAQVASVPGTTFKAIHFQPTGSVGFAVGTGGKVLRSGDLGTTWTTVALPNGGSASSGTDCTASQPPGDLDSIRFAADNRAWITGPGTQLWRTVAGATSANVGAATAGWQWINHSGTTCLIPDDVGDVFPIPGSDAIYFISRDFGAVYFSDNALATTAAKRSADAGNGFDKPRYVAGDPSSTNRMWAIDQYGDGGSYYSRTTDGWGSSEGWTLGNPDAGQLTKPAGVAFAGGTVTAAGSAGMILESVDGATFYLDAAPSPLATEDWRAISMADANNAAIGGAGGKLVVSANASAIPDIVPPTGTISGPSTVVVGQAATFTANVADNAGGSGINPASFAWTATGTPGGSGNPLTLTFPSAGFYSVNLTYRDLAGNAATASYGVEVVPPVALRPTPKPSPTLTKTVTVAGGTVSLGVPRACVPVGSTFKATLSFKRSRKKGATLVKVSSVTFTVDKKRKTTDKKAPFVKTISVKALKAGSKHTLKARATIKVKHGRSPKKSITASFTVCG